MIGLIIAGLILVPLLAMMMVSVITSPRSVKVAGMFTTVFLLQIVIMIVCFTALGWIFGLVMQ